MKFLIGITNPLLICTCFWKIKLQKSSCKNQVAKIKLQKSSCKNQVANIKLQKSSCKNVNQISKLVEILQKCPGKLHSLGGRRLLAEKILGFLTIDLEWHLLHCTSTWYLIRNSMGVETPKLQSLYALKRSWCIKSDGISAMRVFLNERYFHVKYMADKSLFLGLWNRW